MKRCKEIVAQFLQCILTTAWQLQPNSLGFLYNKNKTLNSRFRLKMLKTIHRLQADKSRRIRMCLGSDTSLTVLCKYDWENDEYS